MAWFRNNVSSYARDLLGEAGVHLPRTKEFETRLTESLAEAFAWYTSPGYIKGSMPLELEEQIKDMAGE